MIAQRVALSVARHLSRMSTQYVQARDRQKPALRTNERPIEYAFVCRWANQLQPRTILDVGTGRSPLPALLQTCGFQVTAMDNIQDYWPAGMYNPHGLVVQDNILAPRLTGPYDLVTCISVLEHITEPDVAVGQMLRLLRPGGHLLLTHPYHETRHVPNVYRLPGSYGARAPYPCQQYTRRDVTRWQAQTGARLVAQEYWQCFEAGADWSCGALVRPPVQATAETAHQLTCLVLQRP